jgi:hypothetical protein
LATAIKQQVRLIVPQARDFYQRRQYVLLEQLLASCAPAAAVMVNLEISLTNTNYMEEGGTLSRTLLPYINKVQDYRFLGDETHFIASRFLASLVTHVKDIETTVEPGFILFALNVNPRAMHGIFKIHGNVDALKQALTIRRYPPLAIAAMTLFPEKFLWQGLLESWADKSAEAIGQSASILAKMDILTDPGPYIPSFLEVLAQRSLLVHCLGSVDRIRLNLPRLVSVLEKLASLSSESITTCLEVDSTKWETLAT